MSKRTYFLSCPDSQGPGLRKLKEHPLEVPEATTPSSPELQEPGGGGVLWEGEEKNKSVMGRTGCRNKAKAKSEAAPEPPGGCTASNSLGEDLRSFCKL